MIVIKARSSPGLDAKVSHAAVRKAAHPHTNEFCTVPPHPVREAINMDARCTTAAVNRWVEDYDGSQESVCSWASGVMQVHD
jgi:hypothetical protein